MRRSRLLTATAAVVAAAAALAGCGGGGGHGRTSVTSAVATSAAAPSVAAPSAAVETPASPDAGDGPPAHVLVAIFENKDYDQIAGNPAAPYLNALMGRAAVLRNSRAITHPSQPNYLALFSGSTQGITDDRCFDPLEGRPNLGRQLLDAGHTFVGYSEGMPGAGYTGCSYRRYAAKHNPWVHFANLPAGTNQPFTALPGDFGALPTVAFVVPDMCNDMHDCPIRTGDRWARAHLDPYLQWADTHNSLLIVTFDENDNSPGNRIVTLFAGAPVRPGVYDEPVDHYRVLRTIESLYGLPGLGQAAGKRPLSDIWRRG